MFIIPNMVLLHNQVLPVPLQSQVLLVLASYPVHSSYSADYIPHSSMIQSAYNNVYAGTYGG